MSGRVIEFGSWATLILDDWRDHADALRAAEPAVCITDPPYGIAIQNAGLGGRLERRMTGARQNALRRGSPPMIGDDRVRDVSDVFSLAPRTIMWGADHLRASLPGTGRFLVWDKLDGRDAWDSFSDAEFAFDTVPGKVEILRQLWKGVCCDVSNADAKRWHPAAKPIRLMERLIEMCKVPPGGLVCDPYMGSATTAIACHRRGLRFIGCEIDEKWFDAARERLRVMTGEDPSEWPRAGRHPGARPGA